MRAADFLQQCDDLGLVGDRPPADFEFDGCTSVPDVLHGVDCRPACLLHDWSCETAPDASSRALGDANFYRNLQRCGLGPWASWWRYAGVRLYSAKQESPWRLLWALCVDVWVPPRSS